ncbi:MAG: 5'/3'-nucleotidase SurE [Bacteroidales bacterium]
MRKILITNDDGFNSKGIEALATLMENFGKVTVVAPLEAQSGMSTALSIGKPLRFGKIESKSGRELFVCSGTPADCVKMSMNKIFTESPPSLLVSGVNHGSNTSVAALYSGTLGAAAEGTIYGIPSIAFSLSNFDQEADFSAVIHWGRAIIENFIEHPPLPGVYLNVNFPSLSKEEIKGVRFAHQGKGRWINEFEERVDPYGYDYYWMRGEFFNLEPSSRESDHNLIEGNYISIVPHTIDTTSREEKKRLNALWKFNTL